MCKYPASECKPIEEDNEAAENETAEEDNAMSEDEDDEASDSESYYTESSIDLRSDSDSDGESATGHRVTPDMVLLLMLKEHGAITVEKYAEKAENCELNFRSLIPKLPKSPSLDSLDYTEDLSEEENSNDDNNAIQVTDKELEVTGDNDISNDNRDIAFIKRVYDFKEDGAYSVKDNINISKDRSKQCSEEIILQEQEGKITQHEITHVEEIIQHYEIFEVSQKDDGREEHLKATLEKVSSDICVQNQIHEINRDCSKDNVSECIGTVSMKDDYKSQEQVEDIHGGKVNKYLQEINLAPIEDKIVETNKNNNETKDTTVEDIVEGQSSNVCKLTTGQAILLVNPGEVSKEDYNANGKTNLAPVEDNTIETKKYPTMDITDPDIISVKFEEEFKTDNQKSINTTEVLEPEQDKIETYNNSTQDTAKQDVLIKPEEESQNEKQKPTNSSLPAGKITKSFKYILKRLIKEKRIPKEDEKDRISDEYGEDYATHLLSFADSLDQNYQNNTILSDDDDSEDDDNNLREFAIYLNFYSPSSYKYILETYNTPLPELKVLYSWYLKDEPYPGISQKALDILKVKSSIKSQICTLMLIDVYLKNEGHSDQVDYGYGENTDFEDKAVMTYIFVLVSLDEEWKMPIGYILARNIPAETQAEYIRICLTHCHDAGVDVVAVTLENPTPAEFLGCSFDDLKNLKTTFKHPSCDKDIAIWIDPCLALKSARQTLKVKGVLKDDEGNKIRWNLIKGLRRLYTDDSRNLEKPEFFELRNHIAKIGLTSETFSKSLIPALELGEKLLPDMFTEIGPTKRYIGAINMLYNILNSRITNRMREIAPYLQAAKKYLIRLFVNEENKLSRLDRDNLDWKRMQGYRYFLKGEPVCGFIGFLICIESFKHLYRTLVKTEKRMNCLIPQRLCKVQAENLVNNLRAYDWNLETLSGNRFRWFYERLFGHLEKNPQFNDKSVPTEHWPLQARFPPTVTIKLTSGKRSYDDVYSSQYKLKKMKKTDDENNATKLVREYSKAMDTEKDLSIRKNMVGFLSGWIAARFAKCLKCEACIDSLCTAKKLWFHKYITLKRIYAVCLPSEEIFQICWECERALRLKGSPARLRTLILRRLAPKFPWSLHSKRSKHAPAHHIHLARAVIAKYISLRIPTPFSKKDSGKIVDMFQRFTKKDPDDSTDKYRLEELQDWLDSSKAESEFEY